MRPSGDEMWVSILPEFVGRNSTVTVIPHVACWSQRNASVFWCPDGASAWPTQPDAKIVAPFVTAVCDYALRHIRYVFCQLHGKSTVGT